MSESPTDSNQQSASSTLDTNSKSSPLIGIIAVILVFGVSGWAGYVYVTGKDGFSWKRFTFQGNDKPNLVAVTGQVFFNGKPMVQGVVYAHPADPDSGIAMAVSKLDKEGKFQLLTDVDGLKPGAHVGTYKVVLNVTYPIQPGQLGPTPRLPKKYYSPETTPVTITVTEDESKNHFVIKEEGEENPPPQSRGGGAKKRPSREELVERLLKDNDKNGDGKISLSEAPERLKSNFERFDTNKDGNLDKDELTNGFQSIGRGKKQPRPKAN